VVTPAALAALRLSLVRGVGSYIGQRLYDACGSFEGLWGMSPIEWQQIEGIGPKLIAGLSASTGTQAVRIAEGCALADIQILCRDDELYPGLLACLDDAPLVLFIQGHGQALSYAQSLAMVGARKCSRESQLLARRWSQWFSNHQVSIISGMAYGIDTAAHGGALQGKTATIAVLGCGLMALQGRQKEQVASIIEHGGCVVSEYLPEHTAKPENFPQRNRIIAGLALATLVIEADIRSGSLITAHQALGYGREVLAVPGSVLNGGHAGCHQLIRDGATLVDSSEQVMTLLGWGGEKISKVLPEGENQQEKDVLSALERDILHLDALSEACGLTVPELSPILLGLELRGMIERLPGSRYTLGG